MATNAMFLVCDMINDLVHEDGPNGKKGYGPELARRNTIANTSEHCESACGGRKDRLRAGGFLAWTIANVRRSRRIFQGAKKAGMFKLGTWGTEVHPALAPQPGDFDIVKHRVSPFYATNLEPCCALTISSAYMCRAFRLAVPCSPAKDGHDRDYDVFVLEDCCAALSEEQHKAVIDQMQRMTTIVTSKDVTFAEGG